MIDISPPVSVMKHIFDLDFHFNCHSCSGKSAFLFHAAVDVAASGRVAMYVRARSRAEEIPPPLPCGVTPKDMLLANIHMKYNSATPPTPLKCT